MNSYGDNLLKSQTVSDGLGRITETRSCEPNGAPVTINHVPFVMVQDTQGHWRRGTQVTNPYRAGDTVWWTTSAFNAQGRVVSVRTPDNAEVSTRYQGERVLVKDQAGKQRLNRTNALGQLTDVWEITAADEATVSVSIPGQTGAAAGYLTHYDYDALDNLRQVTQRIGTQGTTQTRTFTYDSLSRLTSAVNPESGTVQYDYDLSGNLLHKVDARNVTTTYAYDALNRIRSRSYSDATPAVTYSYDAGGIPHAKGRLTKVSSSVSATTYAGFDALGRVTASAQQTNGQTYSLSYEYDLAGNLRREIYPTGRVIQQTYDGVGRLENVTGTKGAASVRYARDFLYASHGAVRQLTLGNNLIEQTSFNARLQPTAIKLGTAAHPTDKLHLAYDYGTTQNNGNVLSQTISFTGLAHPIIQTYEYDALNRLASARETTNALQSWQQLYGYDRFGNRRFKAGTTLPLSQNIEQDALTNPTISPAINRFDAGQGYGYDNGVNNSAGNLTSAPGYTYSYDAENRMIISNAAAPNQQVNPHTYAYDGDGRRVMKVTADGQETTVFVYSAWGQMVAEYNNLPVASESQTSYLTTDSLGTPRVITKADGVSRAGMTTYRSVKRSSLVQECVLVVGNRSIRLMMRGEILGRNLPGMSVILKQDWTSPKRGTTQRT